MLQVLESIDEWDAIAEVGTVTTKDKYGLGMEDGKGFLTYNFRQCHSWQIWIDPRQVVAARTRLECPGDIVFLFLYVQVYLVA